MTKVIVDTTEVASWLNNCATQIEFLSKKSYGETLLSDRFRSEKLREYSNLIKS